MKSNQCSYEESAVEAARIGEWNDELTAHVSVCPSCQQSSRVTQWMIELANATASLASPLPDPYLIWLTTTQIRRRCLARERALWPIKIAWAFGMAGLAAALASMPGWAWSSVSEQLGSLGTPSVDLPNLFSGAPLTVLAILSTTALVFLLAPGSETGS